MILVVEDYLDDFSSQKRMDEYKSLPKRNRNRPPVY